MELQETHTSNKNVTRLENGEEKELISSHSGGYQPSTDEVSTDYGRMMSRLRILYGQNHNKNPNRDF